MKKLLALLLTAALVLSLYGCIPAIDLNFDNDRNDTAEGRDPDERDDKEQDEGNHSEAPSESEEETETEPPFSYEGLVYTGFQEERVGVYEDTAVFSVPQINIDDPAVAAINEEIMEEMKAKIYTDEGGGPAFALIDYEWGYFEDILSVVVHTEYYHNSWPEYFVYNISLENYERLENEDLFTAYGLDEYSYYDELRKSLAAEWLSRAEAVPDMPSLDPRKDAYAATQYQQSLILQNVGNSTAFVGADGSLQAVVINYTVAGAGYYWGKYPVGTDYELPGDWTVLGRWAMPDQEE